MFPAVVLRCIFTTDASVNSFFSILLLSICEYTYNRLYFNATHVTSKKCTRKEQIFIIFSNNHFLNAYICFYWIIVFILNSVNITAVWNSLSVCVRDHFCFWSSWTWLAKMVPNTRVTLESDSWTDVGLMK